MAAKRRKIRIAEMIKLATDPHGREGTDVRSQRSGKDRGQRSEVRRQRAEDRKGQKIRREEGEKVEGEKVEGEETEGKSADYADYAD